MASAQRVPALQFPSQPSRKVEPISQEALAEFIDECVEFGDVSAETREMLEADFFASLRGGVA
jgi:hypothetical protein